MASQWARKAIKRPGKLGGKGFLSRSLREQKRILDGCVREWGYRSCLGSIMFLERMPSTLAYRERLAELRHYLVNRYSLRPHPNPCGCPHADDADYELVPEVVGNPSPILIVGDEEFRRYV